MIEFKITLSTGKEIVLTKREFDELRNAFGDSSPAFVPYYNPPPFYVRPYWNGSGVPDYKTSFTGDDRSKQGD